MAAMWDTLLVDVHLATMVPGSPYGAVADGALAVADGRIAWLGRRVDLPGRAAALARTVLDGQGGWLLPGLVDCHTHLVYGGQRAGEFERRLEGASYEEIARAGGGIVATVTATRAASPDELLAAAERRLRCLLRDGVTTVEVKSGYGLDTASELKLLRVARALGERLPVSVVTTFLGAHAVPPEYRGRADDYVELICSEMLPAVAAEGLADAVDGFVEGIGFSVAQMERVLTVARDLGLPVKLHAEQLSDLGGARLAARFGALSADHLEWVGEDGVAALAAAGTVAVLLPGAFYCLRETRLPPVELLRRHGVAMAVATDCNPGTSPLTSLLLAVNMACTLFRLTPAEALAGVTRAGARALGLAADRGTLELGKRADLALYAISQPAELAYAIAADPCRLVVRGGERCHV